MDAQDLENDRLEKLDLGKPAKGSKKQLEALLRAKNGPSLEPPPPGGLDPIESAMRRHPGLTREKAEEMARDLGF